MSRIAQRLVPAAAQGAAAAGSALLAVVAWVVLARHALPDPYALFLAVAVCTAYVGGAVPGLFSLAFTVAAAWQFYPGHPVPLLVYVFLTALVVWIAAPVRREQAQLERQIQFTRGVIDQLADGLWVLDRSGRVTYVNAAAQRILGWSRRELARVLPADVLVPASGRNEQSIERAIEAGQEARAEGATGVRRDNSMVPVDYALSPIVVDDRVSGATIVFRDVTEREEMWRGLRRNEACYRGLVEACPDGLIMLDLFGFVTFASSSAVRLLGSEGAERVVGANFVELLAASDQRRAIQDRQRVVQSGESVIGEYRLRRRDGSELVVHARLTSIVEEGKPVALAAYLADGSTEHTSRRNLERWRSHMGVLEHVLAMIDGCSTADEAIWRTMQFLCTEGGWQVGVYWRPGAVQDLLECTHIWHGRRLDHPHFVQACRDATYVYGVGLPGRVWFGQGDWIADVTADKTFSRSANAAMDGLHTAVCFPVRARGQTLGVIELFADEVRPPDQDLVAALDLVGRQLAWACYNLDSVPSTHWEERSA